MANNQIQKNLHCFEIGSKLHFQEELRQDSKSNSAEFLTNFVPNARHLLKDLFVCYLYGRVISKILCLGGSCNQEI